MKTPNIVRNASLPALMVFTILATGCNPTTASNGTATTTPVASPVGSFTSSGCFLNKLASQGIGQNTYTRATLVLNADGSGQTIYSLYADSDCATTPETGQSAINYVIQPVDGQPNLSLIQVDQQNDPSDPTNTTRYWLPVVLDATGYYVDIDYTTGESGPYLSSPSGAELADFVAAPKSYGMFFIRQN